MPISISTEIEVFRSTTTQTRTKVASRTEPSSGNEESIYTLRVAPATTEVIPMGGVAQGNWIFVDAKPEGGTTDVNMSLLVTNSTASGVAVGAQEVRFSSFIIFEGKFTALSIKNIDTLAAVDVQIKIVGD